MSTDSGSTPGAPRPGAGPYAGMYRGMLGAAARLDVLRRGEDHSVDPHATAAMHALRFAALMLYPAVPGAEPPDVPDDSARLLELLANWRDAVLQLGEFAPDAPDHRAVPVLRLLPGGESG